MSIDTINITKSLINHFNEVKFFRRRKTSAVIILNKAKQKQRMFLIFFLFPYQQIYLLMQHKLMLHQDVVKHPFVVDIFNYGRQFSY
jgi:hypothetical protein